MTEGANFFGCKIKQQKIGFEKVKGHRRLHKICPRILIYIYIYIHKVMDLDVTQKETPKK